MSALYANLLQGEFHALAPLLQSFHTQQAMPWQGRVDVELHRHPLLRMLARLAGLPKAGHDRVLTVQVKVKNGTEIWSRQFADQRLRTWQQRRNNDLYEDFGPFTLKLKQRVAKGALYQSSSASQVLGIPLAPWLSFKIAASEQQRGGRLHFSVKLTWLGQRLLQYRGWLTPAS